MKPKVEMFIKITPEEGEPFWIEPKINEFEYKTNIEELGLTSYSIVWKEDYRRIFSNDVIDKRLKNPKKIYEYIIKKFT